LCCFWQTSLESLKPLGDDGKTLAKEDSSNGAQCSGVPSADGTVTEVSVPAEEVKLLELQQLHDDVVTENKVCYFIGELELASNMLCNALKTWGLQQNREW